MKIVSVEDVQVTAVAQLGLDLSAVDLSAPEATSALVRHAAALMAPCSRAALVDAVCRSQRGLVGDENLMAERVRSVIEDLAAYGDLLELREQEEGALLLHTAPPSFVARASGSVFLLGIAGDVVSPLPQSLLKRVECSGCKRVLHPQQGEDLASSLEQFGLVEVPEKLWLKAPPRCDTSVLIADCNAMLERSGPVSQDVAGLLVLDSGRPVRYYKGRWCEAGALSGRLVARREQRYGASLWCYVQLERGSAVRLLDFVPGEWPGCDQAWRLQQALDASQGHPQQYGVGKADVRGGVALQFYSPIPSWAQRHLETVGERVDARGCLFAYRVAQSEVAQEETFLRTHLWLSRAPNAPSV